MANPDIQVVDPGLTQHVLDVFICAINRHGSSQEAFVLHWDQMAELEERLMSSKERGWYANLSREQDGLMKKRLTVQIEHKGAFVQLRFVATDASCHWFGMDHDCDASGCNRDD